MTAEDKWDALRKQVEFLRKGAEYERKRMLHEDGTESMYAIEPRNFRDAYQSVLDLMESLA